MTVLYVCSDPVLTANLDVLVPEAKILNMETMHEIREARDRNGHQTYGANFRLLFTKAAEKANQILRDPPRGRFPPSLCLTRARWSRIRPEAPSLFKGVMSVSRHVTAPLCRCNV